jgi:hypothetical protein
MTSREVRLDESGARALREAQDFCQRANVAIVGAEHLLAGALAVLADSSAAGIPGRDALESALMLAQGAGSAAISEQVMFGSAAREAINDTAGAVRKAGATTVGARELAIGAIVSDNVSPMFFATLGTTRAALRSALESC